jgi:hypothetical protein
VAQHADGGEKDRLDGADDAQAQRFGYEPGGLLVEAEGRV